MEAKAPKKRGPKLMPERTEAPVVDRSVAMSNALARGSHSLNLAEKRILALALAKTDSIPAADLVRASREGWSVRLLAAEYAEAYEVDANTAYEQLQASAQSLRGRGWKAQMGYGRRNSPIIREGNWVSMIEYCAGEGRVDVAFTPHVAPHLLALRSQFTTYKLKQASALRSVYAWRLFECLKSWETKGIWSPSIDEFHAAMDAPESCRANFKDLRRRIIDPAVTELHTKDNMLVEW